MRALVQRVSRAAVRVDGETVASVDQGFLVLVGVRTGDTADDARALADKIANLRVFPDDDGKMNRSLVDAGGGAVVVSQFTLYADTRRGRRPSFVEAARPSDAAPLVDLVASTLRELGVDPVGQGVFGASMDVELVNRGPVTIMLET